MNENLFGQWITYTHYITKERRQTVENKFISVTTHPSIKVISGPKKALIIGERFLQNGRTNYAIDHMEEQYSEGGSFKPTSTTHCLLVVVHPRRNPIRVAIDGAKLLNGLLVKDLM
ncbi:MAG: hypothetical protein ACTSWQ_03620 [Candidatus Thorarchaeota archaeon]